MEKRFFLTCASNEDSDQTARMRNLIRVFVVRLKKQLASLAIQNAFSEDSDQAARIGRLI